jgi:hypothetical protein
VFGGAEQALSAGAGYNDVPSGYGFQAQSGYLANIVFVVND